MSLFLLNILLAAIWMFLWGSFDLYTLLAGLVIGFLLLVIASRMVFDQPYGRRLAMLISFLGYFLKILVKSNWVVAKVVMKPGPIAGKYFHPRLMRYDVQGMTDVQITTLATLITLTPGTLSMDVSPVKNICMCMGCSGWIVRLLLLTWTNCVTA
ncbi:MAG: Na+/H+ antiporter subunit E [Phycisphaerales bacterium]|nr:Na+/H+ antiporter subunit E [Phycisphaerales bacterium]